MTPADQTRSDAANRDAENRNSAHLSLNELAAASLRLQAGIFSKQAKRAAQGQTEEDRADGLHEARVALRRIRIAASKKLRKRIDKVDRFLGRARDAEVILADARSYAEKLPPGQKERFAKFAEDLEAFRDREAARMKAVLKGKEAEKTIARTIKEARRLDREVSAELPRPAGLDAGAMASKAYADLAALEAPALGGRADRELYHDIRRAAKRFRYTLELFAPILDLRSDNLVETAKKLQDYLGAVNDAEICYRAAETLTARWEETDNLLPDSYVEVYAYAAFKRKTIERGVAAFPREWRRIASPAFRRRLHSVLGSIPVDFVPPNRSDGTERVTPAEPAPQSPD